MTKVGRDTASAGGVPAGARVPAGGVVLVLPAHDEAGTVAAVVARAPRSVHGRDVTVLVVDDGSTDRTGALAAAAGAEVVTLPRNQGLGAAVRTGLAWAVERGAAAVAFCDADGEYAPEELPALARADPRGSGRLRGGLALRRGHPGDAPAPPPRQSACSRPCCRRSRASH